MPYPLQEGYLSHTRGGTNHSRCPQSGWGGFKVRAFCCWGVGRWRLSRSLLGEALFWIRWGVYQFGPGRLSRKLLGLWSPDLGGLISQGDKGWARGARGGERGGI